MPLKNSQHFSVIKENFEPIISAINTDGHCILENVWDLNFLKRLLNYGDQIFKKKDESFFTGEMTSNEKSQYFGAFYPIYDEKLDSDFYHAVAACHLPSLFKQLLKGDFALMFNERVLRRVDPQFPVRMSAFHIDGQLKKLSSIGYNSTNEFTIWTPLVELLDDHTPRLILIDRPDTEKFYRFHQFRENDVIGGVYEVRLQTLSTLNLTLEENHQVEILTKRDKIYQSIYDNFNYYAPKLKLSDCIIFDKDIWHSSYIPPHFSKKRISLDFRIVGDHPPISDPGWDGRFFRYKKSLIKRDLFIIKNYRSDGPNPLPQNQNFLKKIPALLKKHFFSVMKRT